MNNLQVLLINNEWTVADQRAFIIILFDNLI